MQLKVPLTDLTQGIYSGLATVLQVKCFWGV